MPAAVGVGNPSELRRGDVEQGLAKAAKRIDATYETPAQYHNAMEPHAIVATWDGDSLSLDTPSQGMAIWWRVTPSFMSGTPKRSSGARRSISDAAAKLTADAGLTLQNFERLDSAVAHALERAGHLLMRRS